MKKILHIQVLPKMAGVQWISYNILQNLSKEEYEKHILFSSDMDEENKLHCKKLFEGIGCKVFFFDSIKRSIGLQDFGAIKDIYNLCKREKYDIVHTNSTKPGVIGRIGAKLAKIPFIIHTVHGLSFHSFIGFPKWQFYWICEMISSLFCDRIALVNTYYSKYFKFFNNKILTIYNGIDFPHLEPQKINRTDTKIKILFVGRLSNQKDPMTMIKAFHLASQKNTNLELTIVGDGEFFEDCKNLVNRYNIQTKVRFEGWQNEVTKYYKTHDIFITTSIYEAFGLVFLEAGFYKLPTIATNVEGIPEVIEDGVTGYLSNPKDIENISENIIKLANDKNLREKMGENAHIRVVEKFNISKMIDAYKRLYKEYPN